MLCAIAAEIKSTFEFANAGEQKKRSAFPIWHRQRHEHPVESVQKQSRHETHFRHVKQQHQ